MMDLQQRVTEVLCDIDEWLEQHGAFTDRWESAPYAAVHRAMKLATRVELLAGAFAARDPEAATGLYRLGEAIHPDTDGGDPRLMLPVVRPRLRAAAAAAKDDEGRPTLTERQAEALEIIRKHGPITEKGIVAKLTLAVGDHTIRRHDIPTLKEFHAVRNDGRGYFIEK